MACALRLAKTDLAANVLALNSMHSFVWEQILKQNKNAVAVLQNFAALVGDN